MVHPIQPPLMPPTPPPEKKNIYHRSPTPTSHSRASSSIDSSYLGDAPSRPPSPSSPRKRSRSSHDSPVPPQFTKTLTETEKKVSSFASQILSKKPSE